MIHLNNIIPTPEVILSIFPTNDAFKEWAEDLIIYDLQYWLERFEEEERYEQCAVLRDVIKEFNESAEIVRLCNGFLE